MQVFLQSALVSALIIFTLRLMDISLYTLRLLMIVHDRKALAWVLSFIKSFLFLIVIQILLKDLHNWSKILAYATGFATGLVVGMWIEEKIAVGYTHLRITSPRRGAELAERLRAEGYAVTEIAAQGKDGMVTLLNCNVLRKKTPEVEEIIVNSDPDAFVTAEAVRSVQRGFWRR
jgi:uncharacterized protein YebE (UPF0316 family)